MPDITFTLREANELLPVIDQELRKLQALKREFENKYTELRSLKASSANNGQDAYFTQEAELEFLQIEARASFKSFELKGVELKDIDVGLVDFPSLLNGEEVLLCWRQGEERIRYYHGKHEGFAGRKLIEE